MEQNLPASDNTIRFKITGELEKFIQSQTRFNNGYCDVYVGGWRFERNQDDPKHIYRLPSDQIVAAVKTYFKAELADCFKDMVTLWLVDFHNGHSETYHRMKVDKDFKDYDWKGFMSKVYYNRISGSTHLDFQRALQENNICFEYYYAMCKEKFEQNENNKNDIIVHLMSGNY